MIYTNNYKKPYKPVILINFIKEKYQYHIKNKDIKMRKLSHTTHPQNLNKSIKFQIKIKKYENYQKY